MKREHWLIPDSPYLPIRLTSRLRVPARLLLHAVWTPIGCSKRYNAQACGLALEFFSRWLTEAIPVASRSDDFIKTYEMRLRSFVEQNFKKSPE
jgi:hypothetical protein